MPGWLTLAGLGELKTLRLFGLKGITGAGLKHFERYDEAANA